jgi:hypothetical protein
LSYRFARAPASDLLASSFARAPTNRLLLLLLRAGAGGHALLLFRVFASEPPPPPTRPSARGPPRGWIQSPALATVGMASVAGGAEEAEDVVPELATALPRHDADVLRGSVPSTLTRTRMRPLRRLLWRQCGLGHHHSRRRLCRHHEHEGVV